MLIVPPPVRGNICLLFPFEMDHHNIHGRGGVEILALQPMLDAHVKARLEHQRAQGLPWYAQKAQRGPPLHQQPCLLGRVFGLCQLSEDGRGLVEGKVGDYFIISLARKMPGKEIRLHQVQARVTFKLLSKLPHQHWINFHYSNPAAQFHHRLRQVPLPRADFNDTIARLKAGFLQKLLNRPAAGQVVLGNPMHRLLGSICFSGHKKHPFAFHSAKKAHKTWLVQPDSVCLVANAHGCCQERSASSGNVQKY